MPIEVGALFEKISQLLNLKSENTKNFLDILLNVFVFWLKNYSDQEIIEKEIEIAFILLKSYTQNTTNLRISGAIFDEIITIQVK